MGKALNTKAYRTTFHNREVAAFLLENNAGIQCLVSNYGARILQLCTPDREGKMADIVLGHDSIDEYIAQPSTYFGACVGRVANRTSNAKFSLLGVDYKLAANEGKHHLHGGPTGFHNQVWEVLAHSPKSVEFRLNSPDGQGGYPGNVEVILCYRLLDENALEISYEARTDAITPINLTNHSYFNLDGCDAGRIVQHVLTIHAAHYCPIAPDFIPTGKLASVAGSPFDFRSPAIIGERLYVPHEQLQLARGFDHHYVVDGQGIRPFAKMYSPQSGRGLAVESDAAGMQLYSGNFLDGSVTGKHGKAATFRSAFCFETQGYPNSLNTAGFPSICVSPEQPYRSRTIYRFSTEQNT